MILASASLLMLLQSAPGFVGKYVVGDRGL